MSEEKRVKKVKVATPEDVEIAKSFVPNPWLMEKASAAKLDVKALLASLKGLRTVKAQQLKKTPDMPEILAKVLPMSMGTISKNLEAAPSGAETDSWVRERLLETSTVVSVNNTTLTTMAPIWFIPPEWVLGCNERHGQPHPMFTEPGSGKLKEAEAREFLYRLGKGDAATRKQWLKFTFWEDETAQAYLAILDRPEAVVPIENYPLFAGEVMHFPVRAEEELLAAKKRLEEVKATLAQTVANVKTAVEAYKAYANEYNEAKAAAQTKMEGKLAELKAAYDAAKARRERYTRNVEYQKSILKAMTQPTENVDDYVAVQSKLLKRYYRALKSLSPHDKKFAPYSKLRSANGGNSVFIDADVAAYDPTNVPRNVISFTDSEGSDIVFPLYAMRIYLETYKEHLHAVARVAESKLNEAATAKAPPAPVVRKDTRGGAALEVSASEEEEEAISTPKKKQPAPPVEEEEEEEEEEQVQETPKKKKVVAIDIDDEEEQILETPRKKKVVAPRIEEEAPKPKKVIAPRIEEEEEEEEEEAPKPKKKAVAPILDDEAPIPQKKKPEEVVVPKKKATVLLEEEEEEEAPKPQKKKPEEVVAPKKKAAVPLEEEEEAPKPQKKKVLVIEKEEEEVPQPKKKVAAPVLDDEEEEVPKSKKTASAIPKEEPPKSEEKKKKAAPALEEEEKMPSPKKKSAAPILDEEVEVPKKKMTFKLSSAPPIPAPTLDSHGKKRSAERSEDSEEAKKIVKKAKIVPPPTSPTKKRAKAELSESDESLKKIKPAEKKAKVAVATEEQQPPASPAKKKRAKTELSESDESLKKAKPAEKKAKVGSSARSEEDEHPKWSPPEQAHEDILFDAFPIENRFQDFAKLVENKDDAYERIKEASSKLLSEMNSAMVDVNTPSDALVPSIEELKIAFERLDNKKEPIDPTLRMRALITASRLDYVPMVIGEKIRTQAPSSEENYESTFIDYLEHGPGIDHIARQLVACASAAKLTELLLAQA